jgi:hypothetical protein
MTNMTQDNCRIASSDEEVEEVFEHNHGKAKGVYIIFSADFYRRGVNTMNFMDPTHHKGVAEDSRYHAPFPSFVCTEEDDDGNETADCLIEDYDKTPCTVCEDSRGIKWVQMHGEYVSRGDGMGGTFNVTLEPGNLYRVEDHGHDYWFEAEPCDHCGGTRLEKEQYRGPHRKWVGELTWDEWLRFAERYCIDLDDDGMPEHYDHTLGSLTEFGHIPAIRVDNTEGWNSGMDDGGVLDSSFYISMFDYYVEPESNIVLSEN